MSTVTSPVIPNSTLKKTAQWSRAIMPAKAMRGLAGQDE